MGLPGHILPKVASPLCKHHHGFAARDALPCLPWLTRRRPTSSKADMLRGELMLRPIFEVGRSLRGGGRSRETLCGVERRPLAQSLADNFIPRCGVPFIGLGPL